MDAIYTRTDYRGRGIATGLNNILNFYAITNNWKIVFGEFSPQQMGEDRKNRIYCSYYELERRAKKFYKSNNFKIIKLSDYLDKTNKFPSIDDNLKDLFEKKYHAHGIEYVVFKELKKELDCGYQENDSILIHNSVGENYKRS